ncbi:P-loop NTPase family protein [Acidimangrovimonas sediminis]|uniref:DnaA ATPase domain-containing protein n=1 Tax=Acidimangrovimonas sediminis TaxID=2056283 RepID=UPI000C80B10D|nr:DnaA/Hda family protein [Acidimangrovimonas sediminis]
MIRQLTFDLPVREALGREDFFVSRANAVALAALDTWPHWPQGKMALTGPAGAGKTHLAHVWAREAEARIIRAQELAATDLPGLGLRVVVEDADAMAGNRPAEEALFHLHNLVLASGGRLLVTAQSAPNRWPLTLPDLASRLQAAAVARLDPPDDALLAAVVMKLFADRQMAVAPPVISYLAARIDRSFAAARDAVARIDRLALTAGRTVTRPLVAEAMGWDGA